MLQQQRRPLALLLLILHVYSTINQNDSPVPDVDSSVGARIDTDLAR